MVVDMAAALSAGAGAGAMAGAAVSAAGVASSLAPPQAATNITAAARAKRFIAGSPGDGEWG